MAEETTARMAEATITDEMIASMQDKVGVSLRIGHSINNEDATRLAIAKFAGGIGDTNPLWTEDEYAKQTRFGAIVAPRGVSAKISSSIFSRSSSAQGWGSSIPLSLPF